MEKCIWCNKKTENLTSFTETMRNILTGTTLETFSCCSDICIDKTRAFCHSVNRNLSKFLIGFAISVVLAFVGIFTILIVPSLSTAGGMIAASTTLVMGIIFFLYPFATPQTVMLIGIEKSAIIARIVGLFLIVLFFRICYGIYIQFF